MTDRRNDRRPPRFGHRHRKRSVWAWITPLLVVLGLILVLPRLAALLGD